MESWFWPLFTIILALHVGLGLLLGLVSCALDERSEVQPLLRLSTPPTRYKTYRRYRRDYTA